MLKRMKLEVNGIVQGVGFRPFIHKLVRDYNLKGWVMNTTTGVAMEVEGKEESLINFAQDIKIKSPKLAVIEKISMELYNELKSYDNFKIVKSTENEGKFTLISPDVCICDDCLRELFDKNNRRYKFPFINCTNCGPRFTIIKDVPYDRDKTTMSVFPMCSECRNEYENIEDRRYHAQPDCCFKCGPELYFMDKDGEIINADAIEAAADYIKNGSIIAIKGLGGFHLACDAENEQTVKELRRRKHRDEKAFALMCRDMETVEKWCYVSEKEKEYLQSFRRPIVLLRKKNRETLKYVAIDNNYLGIMLPYTPVHYLLMDKGINTLVMTSGNISDMPIIHENEDAYKKLKYIVDGFLMNNRDIYVKCDDSVIRVFEGKEYPIRRSRGYVPFPIKVSEKIGQILACGAEQKASFALSKDSYVFLSQHIGDMKNMETFKHYENQINHFQRLFNIKPDMIVCDLHPDYMSTNYAVERAKKDGLPLFFVQHHHAHMASCMADNNISKKVIGITWDGTGYGIDGNIWGGEFLVGDFSGFQRAGSIRPIPLPGGDKAAEEIYRISYSLLYESIGYIPERFIVSRDSEIIQKMMEGRINCPNSSSIGRLFDGAASLLGIKNIASYEGQGAVLLENSADDCDEMYEYNIENNDSFIQFDWRPMIREIADDIENGFKKGIIAAKFMNTLVYMAADIAQRIMEISGIKDIVLSGGVFQNMYLLTRLKRQLENMGFKVYNHSRVSANDEGISLGQCMIAAHGGDIKCV